jgi:hypothetical protein
MAGSVVFWGIEPAFLGLAVKDHLPCFNRRPGPGIRIEKWGSLIDAFKKLLQVLSLETMMRHGLIGRNIDALMSMLVVVEL